MFFYQADGKLGEEISITTDAYSSSSGSDSSDVSGESTDERDRSSGSSVEPVNPRLAKLRRRRAAFLRRRAMERAAAAETEDDDDSSYHGRGPKPALKKKGTNLLKLQPRIYTRSGSSLLAEAGTHRNAMRFKEERKFGSQLENFPSQQLRCKFPSQQLRYNDADLRPVEQHIQTGDRADSAVDSVEDSLFNTTNEGDIPDPPLPSNKESVTIQAHSPKRLSNSNPMPPSQLKWFSMEVSIGKGIWSLEKEIESLLPMDPSNNFMETSHLGQVVIQTPCYSMVEAGIQLGDVIIRLNGKDVRSMRATAVSEMISGLADKHILVTFLRKNMML